MLKSLYIRFSFFSRYALFSIYCARRAIKSIKAKVFEIFFPLLLISPSFTAIGADGKQWRECYEKWDARYSHNRLLKKLMSIACWRWFHVIVHLNIFTCYTSQNRSCDMFIWYFYSFDNFNNTFMHINESF